MATKAISIKTKTIPAGKLTLVKLSDGEVVGGGENATTDLRSGFAELSRDIFQKLIAAQPSRGAVISELTAGVFNITTRTPGWKDKRRIFERYATAGAEKRSLTLDKAEAFQREYMRHTGRKSRLLDDVINTLSGNTLPPGRLTVTIMARIVITTGGGSPDERTRAVPIDLFSGDIQARAMKDPVAEWLDQFRDLGASVHLYDVQWLQMSFAPQQ